MLPRAYLFNPENDSALAADVAIYNPSRAASNLHLYGSLLPLWWAVDEDVVLSPLVAQGEEIKRRFGLKGHVTDHIDKDFLGVAEPWGWSLDARRQLIELGMEPELLPTDSQLATMRSLSHRRLTIEIMERLRENSRFGILPPSPREISSVSEIGEGACYVKLPWSSSGRGVNRYDGSNLSARDITEIEGMIKHQGSVLVERALDKVMDFAALFRCDDTGVHYRGLSIFSTNGKNVYTGNIVAPEEALRQRLAQYFDLDLFDNLCVEIAKLLEERIWSVYRGWLGVDMMVYHGEDDEFLIAPCIEVNLRMTMGVVAHLMRDNKHVKPLLPATFMVTMKDIPGALDLLPTGRVADGPRFRFLLSPGV